MKARTTAQWCVLAAICLVLGYASESASEDPIEFSVSVVATQTPQSVALEKESDAQRIALTRDAAGDAYQAAIARPDAARLAAEGKLFEAYRLVASWADGREQLYLGLQSRLPPTIDVTVFRTQEKFDNAALNEIAALPSDAQSVLEKYFRARAFHLNWRFKKAQPYHIVALRSARLWFDAAATLATRSNSPYRRDDEIAQYMTEYEAKAGADGTFRSRYREVVPRPGYVQGTLSELQAANYAFVGEIPKLVGENRLDEASVLNVKALKALSTESNEVKKAVVKRQGVNVELLESNARYIATMQVAPEHGHRND